jgi:transposase
MGFPPGHRKTTTSVVGLRLSGMVAPVVLDGPVNGDWFEAAIRHVLASTLKSADIAIMDNRSSRKRAAARQLIGAAGGELRFLPPDGPDAKPIEMAFSRPKALLQKAAERTVEGLRSAIGRLVDLITPDETANFFTAAAMGENDRKCANGSVGRHSQVPMRCRSA